MPHMTGYPTIYLEAFRRVWLATVTSRCLDIILSAWEGSLDRLGKGNEGDNPPTKD